MFFGELLKRRSEKDEYALTDTDELRIASLRALTINAENASSVRKSGSGLVSLALEGPDGVLTTRIPEVDLLNRVMLNTLYEQLGADIRQPVLFESVDEWASARRAQLQLIIRATGLVFVETSSVDNNWTAFDVKAYAPNDLPGILMKTQAQYLDVVARTMYDKSVDLAMASTYAS